MDGVACKYKYQVKGFVFVDVINVIVGGVMTHLGDAVDEVACDAQHV